MSRLVFPLVAVALYISFVPLLCAEEEALDRQGEVTVENEAAVKGAEGKKGIFGWKGKRSWGWRKNADGSTTSVSEDAAEGRKGWKLFGRKKVNRRKVDGGQAWTKTHEWGDGEGRVGGRSTVAGSSKVEDGGGSWTKEKTYEGKNGFSAQEKVKGKWKLTKDGLVFVSTSTVRLKDGTVVEQEGEALLRKTADGKLEWLVKNRRLGPDGETVFTTGGESVKGADGKTRWTSRSSATGPDGKGWSTASEGESKWEKGKGLLWKSRTEGEAGKFRWTKKKDGAASLGEDGVEADGSTSTTSNLGERIKAGIEAWKAKAGKNGKALQDAETGEKPEWLKKLEAAGKKPAKTRWKKRWNWKKK